MIFESIFDQEGKESDIPKHAKHAGTIDHPKQGKISVHHTSTHTYLKDEEPGPSNIPAARYRGHHSVEHVKKSLDKLDESVSSIFETVAADSIKAHTSASATKSGVMKDLLSKVAGMSIEDLSKWHNEAIALIGHEADKIPGGAAANNKNTIKGHNVKEDVDGLFTDEDELSEDFRVRTATLFEAALEARMIVERQEMEEEFETRLTEEVDEIRTELTEQVDAYLDYAVKAWAEDNAVAIESSLRNEATMEFIDGLRNLFAEHYIDVPEDRVDVVEALQEKVLALETAADELIRENAALREGEVVAGKDEAFDTVAEGMVMSDAERLRTLTENLEFDGDVEAYQAKIKIVKEHYFKKPAGDTGLLSETFEEEDTSEKTVTADPAVNRYVQATTKVMANR